MTNSLVGAAPLRGLRDVVRRAAAGDGRMVAVVATALVLLGSFFAQSASAHWSHISLRPSRTRPYFACPPSRLHARCGLVADPTPAAQHSGPLREGAITSAAGEASPALRGSGVDGGYSPENLRSAYNLPSQSAGNGQTIAVVDAYDDPNAEADMNAYRSHYGIAECTEGGGCFRKVNETGGQSYPEPEEDWIKEISLDLDMVSATCPNCHVLLVEANAPSATDLDAAENEAVSLGATEISNSFTFPTSESARTARAYNHPGIPITAAAGDYGYSAGVELPAASPHVIAVGGTALVPASNARGWSESVWFEKNSTMPGTQSGCSTQPKPSWQTDSGCPYRTTNDIAGVADPNTPVSVYDSYGGGHWNLFGGTSAATPIIAGAMALASAYTKAFEGAAALYLEDKLDPSSINDVTSGSDGNCGTYLCQAGPGYDGPSGLGSLNGTPEVPPPTASTTAAESITQSEATLSATVDPNGAEISGCHFEYGSPSYTTEAPCAESIGSGTAPVAVSAHIHGLQAHAEYRFRIAIEYRGGSAKGQGVTFTTTNTPAPSVSTEPASAVTHTSATLNAVVEPHGQSLKSCEFQYGATTSYGSSVSCTPLPQGQETRVAVSASLNHLTAGAEYHFRIVAESAAGVPIHGSDASFTAQPYAISVETGAASEIGEAVATLSGTIVSENPTLTSCEFIYSAPLGPEKAVPCVGESRQGETIVVSAQVEDLQQLTTYDYRLVASNGDGALTGASRQFMTLARTPGPNTTTTTSSTTSEDAPLTSSTTGQEVQVVPTVSAGSRVELLSVRLAASRTGAVEVSLRCEPASSACAGVLTLRTSVAVKASSAARDPRVLTLGSSTFSLAGGVSGRVRVHLSPGARKVLSRSRRLRVRVSVGSRAGGAVASSQWVRTLRGA